VAERAVHDQKSLFEFKKARKKRVSDRQKTMLEKGLLRLFGRDKGKQEPENQLKP